MSKAETLATAGIVVAVAAAPVVHLALAADAALPEAVQIAALFATPFVALVGLLFGVLHIGKKVDTVEGKVGSMEIKFDGKMDELLRLAKLEGNVEGRAEAGAEAKVVADRELADEGLRKQGADRLLEQQATPPAEGR